MEMIKRGIRPVHRTDRDLCNYSSVVKIRTYTELLVLKLRLLIQNDLTNFTF